MRHIPVISDDGFCFTLSCPFPLLSVQNPDKGGLSPLVLLFSSKMTLSHPVALNDIQMLKTSKAILPTRSLPLRELNHFHNMPTLMSNMHSVLTYLNQSSFFLHISSQKLVFLVSSIPT